MQDMRTPMNWQESVQCLKSLFVNHDEDNASSEAGLHAMINPGRV